MRFFGLTIAVAALLTGWLSAAARAQDTEIDCSAFQKSPDGSWTVMTTVFIPVQNVRVRAGTVFKPGQTFLGDDMTLRLAKACPNQPMATPDAPDQATQSPAQGQTQPGPFVPLSNYADANGNLDIQRLTCAHLAASSPADVALLATWYSGWYHGLAKKRGINLTQMRYVIDNVAGYCKAYPDKKLADVMELWLKQ
jgi:hypothetical protein